MKKTKLETMAIQDVFSEGHSDKTEYISIYHVHGIRQAMGNIKWHSRPDCSVLKKWNPGVGMSKVIMHDKVESSQLIIYRKSLCAFCWHPSSYQSK